MRLWNRTIDQMGPEAREVLSMQPPQDDAMGVCLIAWGDLSTERPVGMVEGRIPWSACDRWAVRHGMDDDSARILWTVIKRLDIEEMDRRASAARGPADRPDARPPRR